MNKSNIKAIENNENILHMQVNKPQKWLLIITISGHIAFIIAAIIISYLADTLLTSNTKLEREIHAVHTEMIKNNDITIIYLKILILNPKIELELARKIAEATYKNAKTYNRDSNLILAMIHVESNFDPEAVSSVGAKGLMQVMPFWEKVYRTDDFFNIETNIKYGLQILAIYEEMYKELEMALSAYNRGPGMIDASLRNNQDPSNGYAELIMKTFHRLVNMDVRNES